jgi:chemotaxis protein CheX
MHFGANEVCQLVESVWSCVLGWEVMPGFGVSIAREDHLTGCIPLTGGWTGTVLLDCHRDLARHAAAVMFGMDSEDVPPELVRDALGELTNMLGGNLKALFDGPCYLGLPAVISGQDYAVRVLESRLVLQVEFSSRDCPFVVRVLERKPPANGVASLAYAGRAEV